MRSPLIWTTPSNSTGSILIEPEALCVIDRYWQDDGSKPESGGVLLGCRRGTHLQVVVATAPQASDRRKRFWFNRSSRSHQEIALQKWAASGETIDYLGEWHTHPEPNPSPSALDLCEWQKICRQKSYSMVFLIMGWSGAMWVGVSKGSRVLTCVETTSAIDNLR
jgi:integrative and conjugative element protein (TIGR02256 family)